MWLVPRSSMVNEMLSHDARMARLGLVHRLGAAGAVGALVTAGG
jgi:hypothetical protein